MKILLYNYKSLYKITSEEELQEVVKNSEKIRVFGNKQSSADIASGAATLIDITSYNKILSLMMLNLQLQYNLV